MEDSNTAQHRNCTSSTKMECNINIILAWNMYMNKATETNTAMKCTQRLLAQGKVEYRHMHHQSLVSPWKPPGQMCVCAYRRQQANIRIFIDAHSSGARGLKTRSSELRQLSALHAAVLETVSNIFVWQTDLKNDQALSYHSLPWSTSVSCCVH
jgi:hypothetical protein